jgi:Predicted signal transduction protein containing sensor and EAL domains
MEFSLKFKAKLGRHAEFISLGVSALVACAGVLLTLWGVTQAAVGDAWQEQKALTAQVSLAAVDTKNLLYRLNRDASSECTASNLVRLRGVMHDFRYARDIGLFDAHGDLYCTTDLGLLAKPLPVAPMSLETAVGALVWPSLPLLDTQHKVLAIIVHLGRFDVVIDPFFRQDLLKKLRGTLWLKVKGNRLAALARYGVENAASLPTIPVDALHEGVTYRLMPLQIRLVSAAPDSNALLERTLGAADVLEFAPRAIVAGSALSALFAMLVAIALWPRLGRYRSLRYRVADLCSPSHVHCMYQPIVRLSDGAVTGAEVLMRLSDGERVLNPDDVFPHIVAKGLTLPFDKIVIAMAMAETDRLRHEVPGFMLAFNVFPQDLCFDAIGGHLHALCGQYGARPEDITVEVTEHSLLHDAVAEAHAFRKAGFRISVDDFGTGYSNLGSIKALKPDHLKIDKSFVFDMEERSMRSSLIPEIIAIARSIGAEVTAEGIETVAQLQMLRELSVEYGQGYLLGKPMPIDEFMSYLRAHRVVPPSGPAGLIGAEA